MAQDPQSVFARRRRRREIATAIAAEHELAPRPRGWVSLARQVGELERTRSGGSSRARRVPAAERLHH